MLKKIEYIFKNKIEFEVSLNRAPQDLIRCLRNGSRIDSKDRPLEPIYKNLRQIYFFFIVYLFYFKVLYQLTVFYPYGKPWGTRGG